MCYNYSEKNICDKEGNMELYNKEIVKKARLANLAEKGCVYHHPTEKDVVKKCIDLSCRKPLHDIENRPESDGSEKWLEAYVIQLAKHSNQYKSPFQLTGVESHYYFLDSQRNFKRDINSHARPLDCLLFEPETHNIVVLELKADRNQRMIAIEELAQYTKNIFDIKDEIAEVFNLGEVSAVEGYIVWPGDDKYRGRPLDFDGWGIIGYDANEIVKQGKLTEPWISIIFKKYRPSKLIK